MRGLSVSDIIVLIDLGLGLAAGNLDENDIQQWIKAHR
jgi:hypothetical protein